MYIYCLPYGQKIKIETIYFFYTYFMINIVFRKNVENPLVSPLFQVRNQMRKIS